MLPINFSIVVIAKNEAKTLPKMAESAKDFLKQGGEICVLDTGSTDDTINVAKNLGFNVVKSPEGMSFRKTITQHDLKIWKKKYNITSNPVKTPASFFCFDEARNEAAKIAKNDLIFFMDGCDSFINFDFNKITDLINQGHESFLVLQKYRNNEGIINRFYNRKKGFWVGKAHEFVECKGIPTYNLDNQILFIDHDAQEKERQYMAALIYTHYDATINTNTPAANFMSRWNYYLGRELYFFKFFADARKLFQKCFESNYYQEERAAAMCLSAKCRIQELKLEHRGAVTNKEIHSYYKKAYSIMSTLREPYFEMCEYYKNHQKWAKLLKIANEGLQVIKTQPIIYFEEERFHKPENFNYYLYISNWWTGAKDMSFYYWKQFVKSHNIDEKNHDHWKMFFSNYRYLPSSIPKIIAEFDNKNCVPFKYITNVDIENNKKNNTEELFSKDDLFFMNFMKKYIPPQTDIIEIFSQKGYRSMLMSKIIFPNTIHCFESSEKSIKEINANAFLNYIDNLKTYDLNFLEKNRNSAFVEKSKLCLKSLTKNGEYCILDDYFNEKDDISVITINIHNEETHISDINAIIANSSKIINRNNPVIAITWPNILTKFKKLQNFYINENYNKISLTSSLYFIPKMQNNTKRVAIVCVVNTGNTNYWDEIIMKEHGFGEAEQIVVDLADSFAKMGYLVDVFGNPDPTRKYRYGIDNPRYIHYDNFHSYFEGNIKDKNCNGISFYYDSIIWWRFSGNISLKYKSTTNILWLHDYVTDFPDEKLKLIDSIVFQSENHKNYNFELLNKVQQNSNQRFEFLLNNKELQEKIQKISHIIPNGFNIFDEKEIVKKIPFRCIYLNNHAYGLHIVLDSWPIIREKFSDATLYIFHDTQTWGIKTHIEEAQMKERILNMENLGVVFIGKVNQSTLYKELLKSEFWLYPCIYNEPYCIQCLQVQSAGVIPIVSDQPFFRNYVPQKCILKGINIPNSIQFSQKCIEIMSLNLEDINEILKESKNFVNENYKLDKMAENFSSIMFK
jgi:glycosyltransferase involved in cell wall biosynthesis